MEIPKQVTICTKHLTLVGLVLFTLQGCADSAPAPAGQEKLPPNIVFILADDLGYGDVSFLNRGSKISTPHMDNLAAAGMVFRDAHSGSAVCTPTRYGILTGRYAWRSRLKSGVLWGYSPPLIESGRTTVASFLKKQGYSTACVGKWHLGLGWHTRDGTVPSDRPDEQGEAVDFSKPIGGGPTAAGFDYFFGVPTPKRSRAAAEPSSAFPPPWTWTPTFTLRTTGWSNSLLSQLRPMNPEGKGSGGRDR